MLKFLFTRKYDTCDILTAMWGAGFVATGHTITGIAFIIGGTIISAIGQTSLKNTEEDN